MPGLGAPPPGISATEWQAALDAAGEATSQAGTWAALAGAAGGVLVGLYRALRRRDRADRDALRPRGHAGGGSAHHAGPDEDRLADQAVPGVIVSELLTQLTELRLEVADAREHHAACTTRLLAVEQDVARLEAALAARVAGLESEAHRDS